MSDHKESSKEHRGTSSHAVDTDKLRGLIINLHRGVNPDISGLSDAEKKELHKMLDEESALEEKSPKEKARERLRGLLK